MKMFKRFKYSHEDIEEIPLDEQSMTDNMRDKTYYVEDFDEIVDLCNRLWLDYLSTKGVLHDFIDILNNIQSAVYSSMDEGKDLTLAEYSQLYHYLKVSRDMLENMDMEIDKER